MCAVTANGAPGDLFASINGTGENGGGSINQYMPTGVFRTIASGLSRPRGVAFGPGGSLFVATNTFDDVTGTFQVSVVKITSRGVQNTIATLSGNFFGEGVTFDRAGNLFVMAEDNTSPTFASTIYKFTPGGVQSTFGSLPGGGFGLAFDNAGNLFATDAYFQTIYKFTPDGTRSVFVGPGAFDPDHFPTGLAFDRFGNLFVGLESDEMVPCSNDWIGKFTPDGMGSTFATDVCYPRGLAFDRSGNLFVADIGYPPPGEIIKFTPQAFRTVFAVLPDEGINSGPQFLAFQTR
jgi:DNA-binding beta-propeller fold protein YncE